MQSFLAYRRFGRNVQAQYERDKHRAEALERGNEEAATFENQQSQHSHRRSSIDNPLYNRDTEKAQQPLTPSREEGRSESEDGAIAEKLETVHSTRTNQSFGTRLGHVLTGIEVRQLSAKLTKTRTARSGRMPPSSSEKAEERETVFVVGYEENDEMDPHNWSYKRRIFCTIMIAWIGFIVGFASAVDSGALTQAAAEFHVGEVAESLATAVFLIAFGIGALFAGPISETVGRNPVYITTMALYMIWIMAAALAPNFGAQLVFRFFAGLFGSTPLTCAGGSISDLWSPMERVYAFPVFANAAFLGPVFGPLVGGFVGQSNLVSWRWCEWITLIISGAILLMLVLFQPETYAPTLLQWKAAHLRRLTGDDRYVAEADIRSEPFWTRLLHSLYRPFLLFFREPIVILFALYLTVVYIILFTFLDGYTYIFGRTYNFSQGLTGLAFLGIAVGLCLATLLVPLIHHWAKRDLAALQRASGDPRAKLPPEKRLYFAMFGAPAIPISLFWMGWTNYAAVSPWSDLASSLLFGYGILCIFISTYQYIIDSYERYAASALASISVVRYVAAGGMVPVGIPFYRNLGVHWTLTILGAVSALMVPVPYLFYLYGARIRGLSKYAAAGA